MCTSAQADSAATDATDAAKSAHQAPRTTLNTLLAGFGGQGILFAGKLLAYAGLLENREVSWLPSYGPEMRGGTANCSVCLATEPIGSPLVTEPEVLVALNQPSFDTFIDRVAPGGIVLCDSGLVDPHTTRTDVTLFAFPATETCADQGLKGLANVMMVGKIIKETGILEPSAIEAAIDKSIPPKRAHLIEPNKKAFMLGYHQK